MRTRPGGYLQPRLLLLIGERPDHGYRLFDRLRRLGVQPSSLGGVYGALRQLERAGFVRSTWDQPLHGPAHRIYELTTIGAEKRDAWSTTPGSVVAHPSPQPSE